MSQAISPVPAVSSLHRYFSWRSSADGPPIEFPNGSVWDSRLVAEWKYPLNILSQVQQKMPGTTLRFYFTKNPYELPEYGNDVVAILWQEERCKIHLCTSCARSHSLLYAGYETFPRLSSAGWAE